MTKRYKPGKELKKNSCVIRSPSKYYDTLYKSHCIPKEPLNRKYGERGLHMHFCYLLVDFEATAGRLIRLAGVCY